MRELYRCPMTQNKQTEGAHWSRQSRCRPDLTPAVVTRQFTGVCVSIKRSLERVRNIIVEAREKILCCLKRAFT